jgi:sugar phosphate isomerase/epimerase
VKLGVNTYFLHLFEFEEGLRFARDHGVKCLEVALLGEPSLKYCDMEKLLADRDALRRWLDTLAEHGLAISGFTAHGEPLSSDPEVVKAYSSYFQKVCRLAEAAGAPRLIVLSGIPAGAPGDSCPTWIVDSFPLENRRILRWQWEERLIPFWQEHGKIAEDHGCVVCVEPQIGQLVHSPTTMAKLRQAVGPVMGCNFDPSHMFVQQIDVLEAIRYLGDAIHHVHVKDTRFFPHNMRLKGVLDNTSYAKPEERAWNFTLIGWGHDQTFWRDFVSTLRFVGYEGALSVEMESNYINVKEGLEKSFAFLKPLLLEEPTGTTWWEHSGLDLSKED